MKRLKKQVVASRGPVLDMEGVVGSTPTAWTKLKLPNKSQVFEIPKGWVVEERPVFRNFEPAVIRVLRKISRKKFEKNLNASRKRRTA